MKFIKIFSFLAFILGINHLKAQEIVIPADADKYNYELLGRDGILVYYEKKTDDKKVIKVQFILYDTNLVKVAAKSVLRPVEMNSFETHYNDAKKTMYFYLYDFFKMDGINNKFKIISFDVNTRTINTIEGKMPVGYFTTDFFVFHNWGYTNSFRKKWHKISLEDGSDKSIDGTNFDNNYGQVETPEFNSSSIISWNKLPNEGWGFKLINYGEGKENKTSEIAPGNTNNLESISMNMVSPGMKLFAGTYTKKLSPEAESNFFAGDSYESPYFFSRAGFYFSMLKDNQQEFIKFVPCPILRTDIDNKLKRKEGDKVSIYRAWVKPPVKAGDIYIVVADIVKVHYHMVKKYETTTSATDITKTRQIVTLVMQQEKIEPEYSLVTAFDEKGNLLWRDSVDIDTRSSIGLSPYDNNYRIHSFFENSLKSWLITPKGLKAETLKASSILSEIDEDDKNEKVSMKEYWYGNVGLYRIWEKEGPSKLVMERY